jgi:CheY-like chemotaxis protein
MDTSSARILVIDDEPDILELVADILDSYGFAVETARSGPLGLAKLVESPFDLLFCDLSMRDMTGWDVVEKVRATDSDIGVVLITGWGSSLSEDDVRARGVDAILTKPFELKSLVDTIERVLGARHGDVPPAAS